jgi:CheY-like chemotaxis protein
MSTKTLIIDDDELSVMLTNIAIKDSPFSTEIETYRDALHALEDFRMNYSTNHKYLIFLDLNMPMMNGWEFLEEIKSFVSTQNTFIFILSSSTDKEDIAKANKTELVRKFYSKPIVGDHVAEISKMMKK